MVVKSESRYAFLILNTDKSWVNGHLLITGGCLPVQVWLQAARCDALPFIWV